MTRSDPRRAAFRVLRDVSSGRYADQSARRRFAGLDARDRGLATELAYGTIRLRNRLDAELRVLVTRPLEQVDPPVLEWLRLGLYQLRETRIPPHAAVSESVAGVRSTTGPRATGMVNAVLRRAAAGPPDPSPYPSLEEDPVGFLTTWGSHPGWLVRRWLDRWPLADVVRLVENDNLAPPVTVRALGRGLASTGRVGNDDLDLRVDPTWPGGWILESGDPAGLASRFDAVAQDPAASAVVDYVGTSVEGPVLDACAAPGGKTIVLSRAAPDAKPFIAADLSLRRLRDSAATIRRLSPHVVLVVMDGRKPAVLGARTVLLDAPCTGSGTLRRRVDARWNMSEEKLASLVRLQAELLEALAAVVEPGGLLVYSTCSLESDENELQVNAFLERHPEFRREPGPADSMPPDMITEDGDLFVRPWSRGSDGAYAARLRKTGTEGDDIPA